MDRCHRFAVVYPDRVREVDSFLSAEAFAALVGQALDLMVVFEVPVPELQIWRLQDDVWHPVFGADQQEPTSQLTSQTQALVRRLDKEYLRLGDQTVRLYRLWKWQLKAAEKQMRKRVSHEQDGQLVRLQMEMEDLTQKIGIINDIVESFSEPLLADVFDFTVLKQYSPQKIADLLHYSLSTVHRQWRQVKIMIGYGLKTRLSQEELCGFTAESERAIWGVSRISRDD